MSIYTYYVYAYLRADGTPYYIGKGTGNRAYDKNHITKPPTNKSRIVFLETNLSNIGALALERRYIQWYGRKDNGTGILRNRTAGGDGLTGVSGKDHPRYGIPRPDLSQRNSERSGTKWSKGTPHFNEGRRHTEETKAKHSQRIRSPHTEETKEKMRQSVKNASAEVLQKRKIARLRRCAPITINGITYESKKAVRLALGLSRYKLTQLIDQQGFNMIV